MLKIIRGVGIVRPNKACWPPDSATTVGNVAAVRSELGSVGIRPGRICPDDRVGHGGLSVAFFVGIVLTKGF